MKLSCFLIRPWLIPFANGTLETDRPAFAMRIARHLDDCAHCSSEATRLESNDAILRGYATRSRGRERKDDILAGSRGKTMTPLSSRVLASIQSDEKLHSSNRWSPNGLSFATAALGVALFVGIINPQSGVFGMIRNFLVPHQPGVVKSTPSPVPVFPPTNNKTPMGHDTAGGISPIPAGPSDSSAVGISQSESSHFVSELPSPRVARYQDSPSTTGSPDVTHRDNSVTPPPIVADGGAVAQKTEAPSPDVDQDNGGQQPVPSTTPSLPTLNADEHPAGSSLNNYVGSASPTDYIGPKDSHIRNDPNPPPAPSLGESVAASPRSKANLLFGGNAAYAAKPNTPSCPPAPPK